MALILKILFSNNNTFEGKDSSGWGSGLISVQVKFVRFEMKLKLLKLGLGLGLGG